MNKVISILIFVSWISIRYSLAFFPEYVEWMFVFHSLVIGSAAVYVWKYNDLRDSLFQESEKDLECFKRNYERM